MARLEQLEQRIVQVDPDEFAQLVEQDWSGWNRQIERDAFGQARSEREKALADHAAGKSRPLRTVTSIASRSAGPRYAVCVMDLMQVDSYPFSDTSSRAEAIQLSLYRKAGPSGRAQVAVDLSDAVRETAVAGIRRRHPEYSEREVALSFLRLVYGFGK